LKVQNINIYSVLSAVIFRTESIIPDDAEEVTLRDFDAKSHNRRGNANNIYEEDDEPRSSGVQCQSQ
jgi:hypothetical protein